MSTARMLPRAATSARAFSTTTARPLAKMQLIGRLANTPEVTPTSTGRDVIRYSLGVQYGARDENGQRAVSWFNVSSFSEGSQRELLCSLPKGTQMYVEADAKMDTYEKDGTKRMSLNLLQRNFEALSRPPQSSSESTTGVESDAESAANEPLSGVGHS
ncbi:hypothetical protein BAUCODRAFT_33064 [Baudoinia panamericana UAMH 10762]|uniref:SsDNA binding protein n=1 Tax=Baudoinia panamericana (strain UAMH 10762) TaxID=717646 RepID=M2N088_BAUPA|nr:uncharacterized protein BAUCODRAFT_33064 [Baudoinia panamericana UAMH 10762]EMC97343.1 hypothetical protein BAUCODRAFT_33064 [Baudoinia panamericana UAMH 10762]